MEVNFAGEVPTTAANHVDEHHSEPAIRSEPDLSLKDVLDATLERHPQFGLQAAGVARAEAESDFGSRWFPESGQLTAFHLSDRAFNDIGAYENEVALAFPIWLPGEKKAQSGFGTALEASTTSTQHEFRWRVSAQLRRALWQLQAAQRQWELATEQEGRLGELLEQVTLFTDAGDFSRADLLATVQELALWKAETLGLEAEYQDAVRYYRALTGLNAVPADLQESLSEQQDLPPDHPALRLAGDHLREATAAVHLAGQRNNTRPTVDVFWRGYRGERGGPDVDALGVGFSMPLGKPPRRNADVALANENLAMAEAEMLSIQRELELQFHEARHQLHTTREQLEISRELVAAASERYQMDRLSFELGEISTVEWLRRLSGFRDIEQSHELLLIQESAAIAAYNQAAGDSL